MPGSAPTTRNLETRRDALTIVGCGRIFTDTLSRASDDRHRVRRKPYLPSSGAPSSPRHELAISSPVKARASDCCKGSSKDCLNAYVPDCFAFRWGGTRSGECGRRIGWPTRHRPICGPLFVMIRPILEWYLNAKRCAGLLHFSLVSSRLGNLTFAIVCQR